MQRNLDRVQRGINWVRKPIAINENIILERGGFTNNEIQAVLNAINVELGNNERFHDNAVFARAFHGKPIHIVHSYTTDMQGAPGVAVTNDSSDSNSPPPQIVITPRAIEEMYYTNPDAPAAMTLGDVIAHETTHLATPAIAWSVENKSLAREILGKEHFKKVNELACKIHEARTPAYEEIAVYETDNHRIANERPTRRTYDNAHFSSPKREEDILNYIVHEKEELPIRNEQELEYEQRKENLKKAEEACKNAPEDPVISENYEKQLKEFKEFEDEYKELLHAIEITKEDFQRKAHAPRVIPPTHEKLLQETKETFYSHMGEFNFVPETNEDGITPDIPEDHGLFSSPKDKWVDRIKSQPCETKEVIPGDRGGRW